MKLQKKIELDGRTGEGGGQLIRVAVALAAVTGASIRITNVRGNRGTGERGGGLKSQHVTSIHWLAEATDAVVDGLSVGSSTLEFTPRRPPTELASRTLSISADSGAASTLLIFQAILPFILYAANDKDEPIELSISGGTHVSWSLSFDYLHQVLLPTLEDRFGLKIERELKKRGWSLGPQSRGEIWLKIHPMKLGEALRLTEPGLKAESAKESQVKIIDISMIVPSHMQRDFQTSLAQDLGTLFPKADLAFVITEDSGHDARVYILLVARSDAGLRWGRDLLGSTPKKGKQKETFVSDASRKVSKALFEEVAAGTVDEHLQDQLVVFQALAAGRTSFPRDGDARDDQGLTTGMSELQIGDNRMRKDKSHEPFGTGSLHTQTARWVVSEMLPSVAFYNKGAVCEGVGWKAA